MTATIRAFAPAKVNLALHVTGQRADGYHLLDSLVVFAAVGDRISATASATLTLDIVGEGAADLPTDGRNLVLRAAAALNPSGTAALRLDKVLPTASGIGGGSSDAAATLRALALLWGLPEPRPDQTLALGADLPVCMAASPVRMRGIGEVLDPVPPLPALHMVLINPRQAVATPDVFRHLTQRDNPPMEPVPAAADAVAFAAWLQRQRNDLQAPAIAALPLIAKGLDHLATTSDCLIARMSGSGATCFGLYATASQAQVAANQLRAALPDWWVAEGPVLTDPYSTRATT